MALLFFALALPVIAIIIGGVDLYLTNRKIPVDAILALIIVLTLLAVFLSWYFPKGFDIPPSLFDFVFRLVLFLGVLCALIQIILAIRNGSTRLARIAIALAILFVLFFVTVLSYMN